MAARQECFNSLPSLLPQVYVVVSCARTNKQKKRETSKHADTIPCSCRIAEPPLSLVDSIQSSKHTLILLHMANAVVGTIAGTGISSYHVTYADETLLIDATDGKTSYKVISMLSF
jgi:hypothetical protein